MSARGMRQEIHELRRVARHAEESCARAPARIDNGVQRKRDGAEQPLFEPLLRVIGFTDAISVETNPHEPVERVSNFVARKHVRFHPAAIRARVPSEVDKNESLLAIRGQKRGRRSDF